MYIKLCYISIFTNFLGTDNGTKSVKTIQLFQLKKIKRTKSRLKRNIK